MGILFVSIVNFCKNNDVMYFVKSNKASKIILLSFSMTNIQDECVEEGVE